MNNGVANFSGGTLLISSSGGAAPGSLFQNNGTFNAIGEADISHNNFGGSAGRFDNAGTFNKNGAGTTTDVGAPFNNSGTVNVNAGTLQLSGGGSGAGGTFDVDAGATMRFVGGPYTPNTSTITGAGDVTFSNGTVILDGGYTLGGVTTIDSGTVVFNTNYTSGAGIDVAGGAVARLAPGGNTLLRTRSVTIASGGRLETADNDVIVDYTGPSPEFALRDKVPLFRDGSGAEGIAFTETPTEDTILAFGEASELGITDFNGFTVDGTTIVGKYTYYGDANLDGQVTTDDYVAVDLGLGTGDSWVQGDFDLNGVVTTDDYVVVDLNPS